MIRFELGQYSPKRCTFNHLAKVIEGVKFGRGAGLIVVDARVARFFSIVRSLTCCKVKGIPAMLPCEKRGLWFSALCAKSDIMVNAGLS